MNRQQLIQITKRAIELELCPRCGLFAQLNNGDLSCNKCLLNVFIYSDDSVSIHLELVDKYIYWEAILTNDPQFSVYVSGGEVIRIIGDNLPELSLTIEELQKLMLLV